MQRFCADGMLILHSHRALPDDCYIRLNACTSNLKMMKRQFAKINFKRLVLFLVVSSALIAFISQNDILIGQWSILNLDGSPSGEYVDFKPDNTYTVALPDGKIGETGTYLLKDSVFSIKNIKAVCGKDYWGQYKLTFYGNDSVHLTLVKDTCSERRMDLVGFNPGLKRRMSK